MSKLSQIAERIELACREIHGGKDVTDINKDWGVLKISPKKLKKLETASQKYNVPKDLLLNILRAIR